MLTSSPKVRIIGELAHAKISRARGALMNAALIQELLGIPSFTHKIRTTDGSVMEVRAQEDGAHNISITNNPSVEKTHWDLIYGYVVTINGKMIMFSPSESGGYKTHELPDWYFKCENNLGLTVIGRTERFVKTYPSTFLGIAPEDQKFTSADTLDAESAYDVENFYGESRINSHAMQNGKLITSYTSQEVLLGSNLSTYQPDRYKATAYGNKVFVLGQQIDISQLLNNIDVFIGQLDAYISLQYSINPISIGANSFYDGNKFVTRIFASVVAQTFIDDGLGLYHISDGYLNGYYAPSIWVTWAEYTCPPFGQFELSFMCDNPTRIGEEITWWQTRVSPVFSATDRDVVYITYTDFSNAFADANVVTYKARLDKNLASGFEILSTVSGVDAGTTPAHYEPDKAVDAINVSPCSVEIDGRNEYVYSLKVYAGGNRGGVSFPFDEEYKSSERSVPITGNCAFVPMQYEPTSPDTLVGRWSEWLNFGGMSVVRARVHSYLTTYLMANISGEDINYQLSTVNWGYHRIAAEGIYQAKTAQARGGWLVSRPRMFNGAWGSPKVWIHSDLLNAMASYLGSDAESVLAFYEDGNNYRFLHGVGSHIVPVSNGEGFSPADQWTRRRIT